MGTTMRPRLAAVGHPVSACGRRYEAVPACGQGRPDTRLESAGGSSWPDVEATESHRASGGE